MHWIKKEPVIFWHEMPRRCGCGQRFCPCRRGNNCKCLYIAIAAKLCGKTRRSLYEDILICERGLVNRVVVGIDYYDCEISKKSCIGVSSKQIKETVLQLKKMGVNVEVAVVFDQNSEEIFALVQWGLENQLVIKVIEKSDFWDHSFSEQPYNKLLLDIQKRFQLKLGITADLHEYYLSNGKTRVKFFQSHCNRNECGICQRLHMRVSCDGMAMPCINRADLTFPLLQGDFDENMNRAIANLGNRPGNDVV